MDNFTLHIMSHYNYFNSSFREVDNRFWLDSSDPKKKILVQGSPITYCPLGYFDIRNPKKSIETAKELINKKYGIPVGEIKTADYLEIWIIKD